MKDCACEKQLETEQNCKILTPTLMAISVVSFSFSRAAQPEARGPSFLLSAGFLYRILSLTHLISNWSPNSIGGPEGPFCWVVASSTASCHQRVCSPKLTDFLSSPSYIIVQSPTQYLWNGMFDRDQVGITVMQFTGHSLPVHQSMSVPWDFTLSHIVIQARLRDFFP